MIFNDVKPMPEYYVLIKRDDKADVLRKGKVVHGNLSKEKAFECAKKLNSKSAK